MYCSPLVALAVRTLLVLAILVPGAPVEAQSGDEKRTLEISDYHLWRTISGAEISDDGQWVSWTYTRVRGDDTLFVKGLDSGRDHTVPRASGAEFSSDGNWIAYDLSKPFAEIEKLERDDEDVTHQAGLLNLTTGEMRSWDDASDFGFSETSSHFFVKKRQSDDDAEHDGTDLILRNLHEGFDELIGSVDQAAFNDAGNYLAFTVDAANKDGNGVYMVDLATGARRALDNAKERYARMAWSEEGNALAVLRGETPEGKVERDNTLLAFSDVSTAEVTLTAFTSGSGLADDWILSEDGNLAWNTDATTLFVGTKMQDDKLKKWADDEFPLADVNIWHWQDDRIQAEQQQSASRDRNRTYVAAAP